VTIAVTGWLLDFMGKYIEGDYDCPHSHARVYNYASMDKEVRIHVPLAFFRPNDCYGTHAYEQVNPDIYLSSDVPFIEKMWSSMLETKRSWNKPNSKMALLYIGAATH